MIYIYVHLFEFGRHLFRIWLVAGSATSQYLNHCWTLNQNTEFFIKLKAFGNVGWKMSAIFFMCQGDGFVSMKKILGCSGFTFQSIKYDASGWCSSVLLCFFHPLYLAISFGIASVVLEQLYNSPSASEHNSEVRSSAIITQSNLSWYYMRLCDNGGRKSIRY